MKKSWNVTANFKGVEVRIFYFVDCSVNFGEMLRVEMITTQYNEDYGEVYLNVNQF